MTMFPVIEPLFVIIALDPNVKVPVPAEFPTNAPIGLGPLTGEVRFPLLDKVKLLKDKFPDGVLWYKVEEDNIADILLSISKVLGEDISGIKDIKIRLKGLINK